MLRVEGVRKHYDGVQALRGAGFSLAAGEVHALMGENGAGKSTLAKIVAGSVRADAGQIFLDEKPVEIRNVLQAQRLGIGIIYQELDLFPHLSIAENIAIGRAVKFRELNRFAQPFLDRVGIAHSPRTMLGSLRTGEMQLVAIARALVSHARVLLMDEPTSSLFDDAVERLFRLIADLKRQGVAIVYVSHRMNEIFRICDRVTVLRDGATVGARAIAETTPDELIRMMVGRDLDSISRREPVSLPVLLSVKNLSTKKLQNISFELRQGEVLGIAGLVGAGRSEIGAALFGLDERVSGSVCLHGREIDPRSPAEAMRLGIALVPEDRKKEGLMMQMSVAENATMGGANFSLRRRLQPAPGHRLKPMLHAKAHATLIDRAAESRALDPVFRSLALKTASNDARVSTLSGGNQQKVLLARCLLANPDVLFLDDPTRGVDVGAKQEIYAIIEKLKAEGKGILLVSSELPELLRCSDRILVMREGRATATFDSKDSTEERIMKSAAL
ncbi:MAG TPA: sugar ABC transporter ATP-binding protein [Bryobacteraceae bacterium]|jgi:ribose transport system ATP-binding protein|nr:sugar ABC transporter ATP-binding protein [Bryobacteraceae bacterium]